MMMLLQKKNKDELGFKSEGWFCVLGIHNPPNIRCKDSEDRLEVKWRVLTLSGTKKETQRSSLEKA